MLSDIISDHKERMINLKKYYPFFKLSQISFEQLEDGQYAMLDMGYILMAVLRFFIEENNFKEKEVVYGEYQSFITGVIKNDFGMNLSKEEYEYISRYIFDKIKNDGRPFDFEYFDPVDRKKKVSRVRILDSTIKDNVVLYSISTDAIEFYLDTKEVKDESRISVAQLLLEKMIRSQNFRGGVEVVARINEEVKRLWRKKDEVVSILSSDVFAGLSAYEEFVNTGMKWFDEEDRLFRKNRVLIENALKRIEKKSDDDERYYKTISDIYELENQLKISMNRHGELLAACTQMQKLTDDAVRRAKLGRLRSHIDFAGTLSDMIATDNADILKWFVMPLLKPQVRKFFNVISIDDAVTQKRTVSEEAEKVTIQEVKEIVFEDELENNRIKENYSFIMDNLIQALNIRKQFSLDEFNSAMRNTYGDRVLLNADYYSFFVNLCQRRNYVIGNGKTGSDSFLDAILADNIYKNAIQTDAYGSTDEDEMQIRFTIIMDDCSKVKIGNHCEISNVIFRKEDNDGKQES